MDINIKLAIAIVIIGIISLVLLIANCILLRKYKIVKTIADSFIEKILLEKFKDEKENEEENENI